MMRKVISFFASFRAPWLLATVASVFLAAAAVWWGGLNQDEGWYLYAAQRVREGAMPYRDFFFTQGPTLPFVYSVLAPLWQADGSPLRGLLGGRVVTCLFGFLTTGLAVALVRRLVPVKRGALAGLTVFALLGCNLYHLYFTTIPKTYALGGFFVMAGFLLMVYGLSQARAAWCRAGLLFASGLSLAFASGTRISLILIPAVAGVVLLLCLRVFRWAVVWYGGGVVAGLFLTYGLFALDPASLRVLLAAQHYHADRGGFDLMFSVGSVSRLIRGYAALCSAGVAAWALSRPLARSVARDAGAHVVMWMIGLGFAAVFLLQLSAPFPYDDYQVPIMALATVVAAAWFAKAFVRTARFTVRMGWFVVLTACGLSFASPLLQEWATHGQDRFWSLARPCSSLAQLRRTARQIERLDPSGTEILTQDLYLAVETGRRVPSGFEMGPFCYFPTLSTERAAALHVMNRERMTDCLAKTDCPIVALSGYAFAIAAPTCQEVAKDEQRRFEALLADRYDEVWVEPRFGQNATTLRLLKLKKETP
jgi:hypothetical protein